MSTDVMSSTDMLFDGEVRDSAPVSNLAGFFFSFRLFFVLLAVRIFQQDAQLGVAASLAINYLLLFVALFTSGEMRTSWKEFLTQPCFRWLMVYTLLTGISLLWSVTASLSAAFAFWIAMVADIGIVLLQLRQHAAKGVATSLMSGYVWGASAIALVAWLMPAQSDLRLGDEELLGPNQIGWLCALAFFFAQYLIRQRVPGLWTGHAFLLGVTLLRSLSKTTIVAFAVAQAYMLLRDRTISRRTKRILLLLGIAVGAGFYSLLANYYDVYTTTGNQSENLTGRIGIWAYIFAEAVDRPWFGHGFHSVWKVIPPFYGSFEARHAHNELLQQFYSYGAVGITVLSATYISIFRAARRFMDTSLRVFFTGMLIFVLVRGTADTEAFDLSWPMWFLALFGALAVQARHQQEVGA